MEQPSKELRLSAKVQQDLITRSKQGVWAQPVFALMILLTTGLREREPTLCWVFAGSVAMLSVLRFALLRTLERDGLNGLQLNMNLGLVLSAAAVWGAVPGVALSKLGYHDKDVLILLFYQAVMTFGMVNLLVHDRRLIAVAMALLFAPTMTGALLHGRPGGLDYVGAAIAYFLYCLAQGKKLNEMYLGHISDNYDLSVAAYRDCLTGLPNRLYLNEALEACLDEAKRRTSQVALLYIDLDGFKQINDQHSHKVGDLFLCEAASRIRRGLRKSDIAARIGGDEFTILLSECSSEHEAFRVAKRVLKDARVPVDVNGERLTYSASIGVSLYPDTAATMDLLMQSADAAMYRAKSSGKNRICMLLAGGEEEMICN